MNIILDNPFMSVFIFAILIFIGFSLFCPVKPSDKALKLCESFEKDNWFIEINETGKNVSMCERIYRGYLKNTDKDISLNLEFRTSFDDKVDYLTSVKINAPYLDYDDETHVVKYIKKHQILDKLIYPELKTV